MPQRLTKRNANLCVCISLIWLVFSFVVTALKNASPSESWMSPIIVWGIQLLLIVGAVYFYKTEKPLLTYWIGDVHGFASAVVSFDSLPEMFQQIALLVPELTEAQVKSIIVGLQKGDDGKLVSIPIEFYNRPEKLEIYSSEEEKCLEEHFKEDEIGLVISTHVDLANRIQSIFDSYTEA